jgi:hypothetical protein
MIMADGPGCGSAQKLYVAESTDGLTWSNPAAVTNTDKSRLDPTGYETAAGSNIFKIYFATSTGGKDMNYVLGSGTLKVAAAAAATATTTTTVSTTKAAKLGGSCTKLGAKTTVNKVKLTCKKVKTKTIWSK